MVKRFRYDAVVVGARCAGAPTAMLLARQGAKVLLVDREPEIGDTLSTHALMRPAVRLLDDWGLLSRVAAVAPAVRETHFVYGAERITVPVKPSGGAEGLYAPRRWQLDRILLDAAAEAGAEVELGLSVRALLRDRHDTVAGAVFSDASGIEHPVRARMVIGADGRMSTVAGLAGAVEIARSEHRSATAYGYFPGLPNQGYRWYFGGDVAAGLIPTGDGMHCLFTSCAPTAFKARFGGDTLEGMRDILARFEPEIAGALFESGPVERPRRFPGAPGHVRRASGPGWALVGDAGYFKDPATAHGISDAFLDAHRLAHALAATPGDASAYEAMRAVHWPEIFRITQTIASLGRTLDEVKTLHFRLNEVMKAEVADLNDGPGPLCPEPAYAAS